MCHLLDESYIRAVRLDRERVPSFGVYPFSLPLVSALESVELHPAVTFFVGENGSGKSTLLEAIAAAWGLNPEGGSRNFSFATRESHSDLHDFLTLVKSTTRPLDAFFYRAESFFNVATEIERLDTGGGGPKIIGAYGGRSLHEQSHGESLISLVSKRFRNGGLYILDEPEAALSPRGVMSLLAAMRRLAEGGAQFIVATHSPMLICYPEATLYELDAGALRERHYSETELFQVSRRFLRDPVRILEELFR